MPSNAPDAADPALTRPYYRLLGFETGTGEPAGRSRIALRSRTELENSRGDVHGGVIASLLDAAMGVALRSLLPEGASATTVSLTVNYLEPGRDVVTATGKVVRAGRTLASLEATAVDGAGRPVAHAVATMRVLHPR